MLSGYYGFGNLGDEALLEVIAGELRRRFPYGVVEALSEEPELTAHRYGIEATARNDVSAIRRAIGRADVVLSGGGGLLQNATSLRSLIYYAGIIRSAVRAGKTTLIFAQSIGPLDAPGRLVVRECCKGIAAATVRDRRSLELLEPLVNVPVRLTADPVFLYDPEDPDGPGGRAARPQPPLEWLGDAEGPLVVVCVRKAPKFEEAAARVAAAVDRLAERYGAKVAFLPIGGTGDAEASTAVIRRAASRPVLLSEVEGMAAVAAVLRRATLVIGMRLHALILAIRLGVPFLALAYDPKVSALAGDIGYPLEPLWSAPALRVKGASLEPIESLVDRAWSMREALAAHVASASIEMQRRAALNFDVLQTLVAKGPA